MQLSASDISAAAGILLSLIFNYVPRVADWYATLDKRGKSAVMLCALVAVAIGAAGLSCANIVAFIACERADFIVLARVFLAALIANQGTYLISPPTAQAERLRAVRAALAVPRK